MKVLNVVIKYRLWLGLVLLILAIFTHMQTSFWPSFVLYFIAVILILGHFLLGPMRLIQGYMEQGDIEGAKKVVNSNTNVKYKTIQRPLLPWRRAGDEVKLNGLFYISHWYKYFLSCR
jgi:hypothetical protein